MGFTFICLGFIEHLESVAVILTIACLLRLVQGLAGATQYTTALCMIAQFAKGNEKPKQLGRNTAVWGTSLMAGPIIGSALYAALGYERMFYVYGGAEVVFALVLRFGIPELVQEEQSKDLEELTPALKGEGTIRGSNISHSNISLHGITHSRVSLYSD